MTFKTDIVATPKTAEVALKAVDRIKSRGEQSRLRKAITHVKENGIVYTPILRPYTK